MRFDKKPVSFQLHSAITAILDKGSAILKIPQKDVEVQQFACEFKVFPIPEVYFNKAFDEMREACLKEARDHGFVL